MSNNYRQEQFKEVYKASEAKTLPEKCKDCIFRCTCGGKRADNH